jgi:lysophospholipase L1-like esterase
MKAWQATRVVLLTLLLSLMLFGCHSSQNETADSTANVTTEIPDSTEGLSTDLEAEQTEAETALSSSEDTQSAPAPAPAAVDDSYFADAVFIGDSRTEGLFLYGSLEEATYLCGKGATVANVSTKMNITIDGADMTIMDALAQTECSKVYISLGLNELGWNDSNIYYTKYGELIDQIRVSHPNAIIYLQDLIPVNTAACAEHNQATYVNNQRIAEYNALLYKLASEKQVILLKVSEAMTNESGELPAEDTIDGIHCTPTSYELWCDYLRTHTADPSGGQGSTYAEAQSPAQAGASTAGDKT